MKEGNIAKVYALALLGLGADKKIDIVNEMVDLTKTINSSNDLENVLFLEVFTTDEKKDILEKIAPKAGLSDITLGVLKFLVDEKRIGILPLIVKEMVVIDDDKKGFLRGTVEGASANIDQKVIDQMRDYLGKKIGKNPSLTYVQNTNITAGYKVTVEDLQLDASLDSQFNRFKQSVIID